MAPRLALIAAVARNGVIGVNNALPWRLPDDLRYFKALTLGHPIVMGRKTWESLPGLLPGRTSVVITRDPAYRAEGATVVHSLEEALAVSAETDEIFVVGGADLYAQALPRADRLYLTEIQADYAGDARFPAFQRDAFREVSREVRRAESGLEYHFVVYDRLT